MAQLAFRATCKRGHDLETFTDRKAFEAHMAGAHNRKMSTAKGAAAVRPYPWKAPRPTAGGLEKVARDLAAGKYDVTGYISGRHVWDLRMGEVA